MRMASSWWSQSHVRAVSFHHFSFFQKRTWSLGCSALLLPSYHMSQELGPLASSQDVYKGISLSVSSLYHLQSTLMRSSSKQSKQPIFSSDELSIHIHYSSPETSAPKTRITITPQALTLFKNYKPSTTPKPSTNTMGRLQKHKNTIAYYPPKSTTQVPSK